MHADKKLPTYPGTALKEMQDRIGLPLQIWANLAQSLSEQRTASLLLSRFTAYGQPFLLHRNKGELHVLFFFVCVCVYI